MAEKEQKSTMGLNIKNPEVERLAGEVAALARESKTEASLKSLTSAKQVRAGTGLP